MSVEESEPQRDGAGATSPGEAGDSAHGATHHRAGSHDMQSDDSHCWVCGKEIVKRHCKIVCPRCGFTRDCSDP